MERELRADPGLSFKLLRIVNVAATGGRGINSILHAIRLVGRSSLYRWLSLLFVSATPRASDVDRELVLLTLERGRFCELIALEAGNTDGAGALFLAGLLSSFDTVLGVPMEKLLSQVQVSDEVAAALLGQDGPYTQWLRLASSYAVADWDTVVSIGERLGVLNALPRLYGEAGAWARGILVRD
jgi:EAL and modified HD-GYP domain-containing signal transduction protein